MRAWLLWILAGVVVASCLGTLIRSAVLRRRVRQGEVRDIMAVVESKHAAREVEGAGLAADASKLEREAGAIIEGRPGDALQKVKQEKRLADIFRKYPRGGGCFIGLALAALLCSGPTLAADPCLDNSGDASGLVDALKQNGSELAVDAAEAISILAEQLDAECRRAGDLVLAAEKLQSALQKKQQEVDVAHLDAAEARASLEAMRKLAGSTCLSRFGWTVGAGAGADAVDMNAALGLFAVWGIRF